MAKAKDKASDNGSPKALIWMLAFFMVVLCALTGLNLYMLMNNQNADASATAEEQEAPEPVVPIFVDVGPMTVNLKTDSFGQRLLYAGLSLRVEDEATRDQLATHMPAVHSRLLVLLSNQRASELQDQSGKDQLAQDILALFEEPLAEGWAPPQVEEVFFSDFILQ